jgi:hypothetical protein
MFRKWLNAHLYLQKDSPWRKTARAFEKHAAGALSGSHLGLLVSQERRARNTEKTTCKLNAQCTVVALVRVFLGAAQTF